MTLSCCAPTSYDGNSTTIVHGPLCDKAERPLTAAEYAEWRGHPVAYKDSPVRLVTEPVPTRKRKRKAFRREWWNHGFRDPAWEDFS